MAPRNAAGDSGLARGAPVDPALLPALLTIAVGLLLAIDDGGFGGDAWYPVALFELGLLVLIVTVARRRIGFDRRVGVALSALAGFALWALASALWSDVPALAWDGANLVLLYAIVLAIVAATRWSRRAFAVALALVGGGLVAIAVGVLVQSAVSADSSGLFIESRLSAPTGYANATAGLWLIGFWPALALACASRTPAVVRVAALGGACLLLETALLSVSRGALLAAAITALVVVAVSRERLRVLAALMTVVGCTVVASARVLAVGDATSPAELDRALGPARAAIAWTCVLAIALATAAVLVARRAAVRPPAGELAARRVWASVTPTQRRRARGAAIAVALVASLAVLAAGHPASWAQTRWEDFKTSGYSDVGTGSQRITGSLGSGRYDFYRVALDAFADRPLTGIGYGNFQVAYLADRRTDEAPRYTHSLALGVLSQVGLIGAALLLAFLFAIADATRRALARAGETRTLAVGALAGFTVWFVHGLLDWLWEFPALGILSFALLGLAARGATDDVAPQRRRPRLGPRAQRVAVGVAALAVTASFVTLGSAARLTRTALDEAPRDPARAIQRLGQAASIDRLAASPLLTRGVLALRLGDRATAERAFVGALEREPRNWFAELELGVLYAGSGRRAHGLRALARAQRLNPRQRLIDEARRTIRDGGVVDPAELERSLYEHTRRRVASVPPG